MVRFKHTSYTCGANYISVHVWVSSVRYAQVFEALERFAMIDKIKMYSAQLIMAALFVAGWGSHAVYSTLYDNAVVKAIAETRELAALSAAQAISKIEISNTTIQGRVTERIKTEIQYINCKHDAATLSDINEALGGTK